MWFSTPRGGFTTSGLTKFSQKEPKLDVHWRAVVASIEGTE
jgi:hypothetical protein